MRKKYLSALLFGALLVTSAGTFTSCKDYDDDINNLQEQITANADAIKKLQEKIDSGKWITELTSVENGFKVTFSDGQSFEIVNGANGTDGKAGTQITIGEDGYWYFDNVKSEYKAVADETAKTKAPYIEDGYWYFYNEKGEAVKSDYKAVGAAYAVAVNGGYNLYLPDANGEMLDPIFVAGAAAAIESITILNEDYNAEKSDPEIEIKKFEFYQDNKDRWKKLTGKTITDKKFILASATEFPVRVNPVSVQLSDVDFYLTNSKNETLPNVVLKASEYKEYVSRADYGNGLYSLSMVKAEVNEDGIPEANKLGDILYALNANNSFRADYKISVSNITSSTVVKSYDYKIGDFLAENGSQSQIDNNKSWSNEKVSLGTNEKVDVKKIYKVTTYNGSMNFDSNIYDMWLSTSDADKNLFDIQFDQENHSFSVNADPDVISKADFVLTVHTLTNNGIYVEQPIEITVSNRIVADAEYAKIDHTIKENKPNDSEIETKNFFTAEMSTMLNSLGDQLDAWKRKVTNASIVGFYAEKECTTKLVDGTTSGITMKLLKADNSEVLAENNANIIAASKMKFVVDNNTAPHNFDVDKTYYAKISFTQDTDELNYIVIPVEFNVPTLASEFEIKSGYLVDDVINAYFYKEADQGVVNTSVDFAKYFAKTPAEDDNLEYELFGHQNAAGDELLEITNTEFVADNDQVNIDLVGEFNSTKNEVPEGYGKTVTVKVTKEDYYGWAYKAEGSDTYSFKIKLLSPIYEGTVVPVEGQTITIKANDLVNGALITDKMITGKDYAGNTYNVVPDTTEGTAPSITNDEKGGVTVDNNARWANPQIAYAIPQFDKLNYIKGLEVLAATEKTEDAPASNGAYKLTAQSISQTVTLDLPVKVKDAWGYIKIQTVKVTIEK